MTAEQLRDLLAEVEARGGPVEISRATRHTRSMVAWGRDDNGMAEDGFPLEDFGRIRSYEDSLVGVLKRDLAERGRTFTVDYADDGRTDGRRRIGKWHVRVTPYATQQWDSELEAVLKAWLAAAKAEGWTP